MFFKNREKEEQYRAEFAQNLEEKFQALKQELGAGSSQMEEMNRKFAQLQTSIQKHDMALEDMLETWEEKSAEDAEMKARLQEDKHTEEMLLHLFEAYQEQFWNLKRFADAADNELSGQMTLMEKNLQHYRQLNGISIIGECGAEVDYDLHEVIEVLDTADSRLDGIVAVVYNSGYLYKGHIKKKAQVAVYRAS